MLIKITHLRIRKQAYLLKMYLLIQCLENMVRSRPSGINARDNYMYCLKTNVMAENSYYCCTQFVSLCSVNESNILIWHRHLLSSVTDQNVWIPFCLPTTQLCPLCLTNMHLSSQNFSA